jgi:hypothetical protein
MASGALTITATGYFEKDAGINASLHHCCSSLSFTLVNFVFIILYLKLNHCAANQAIGL